MAQACLNEALQVIVHQRKTEIQKDEELRDRAGAGDTSEQGRKNPNMKKFGSTRIPPTAEYLYKLNHLGRRLRGQRGN